MLGGASRPGGSFIASDHPLHPEFMAALADDPDLNIFDSPEGVFVMSSTGHGYLIEEGRLPGVLIASAASAHDAKGGSEEDLDGFLEMVSETLTAFRRLIAGEEATAVTLVAFDGLTLEDGARVETPWGWLRPATRVEAATTPMNLAPTVVLAMERPMRVIVGEGFEEEGRRAVDELIRISGQLLPLAALLAIAREEESVILGQVWSTSVEPGFASPAFGVSLPSGQRARHAMFFRHSAVPLAGAALTQEEEKALKEWSVLVGRFYDPAIEIAVQRTMSALIERDAAHDALIDAVIALESLFGHGGTTEVGFRVTAAAAHLLEPDPAKRADLKSRLTKVYDARSKVIHGAALKGDLLSQRREEAIDAAVDSLRAFFLERPHLIADPKRGMRLILGTADDPSPEAAS
jgi:Apea-like HEPN